MKKADLMKSLGECFEVEPTISNIAYALQITTQTVRYGWPDELSRKQLSTVVGDIIRKGKKVPADIVAALKAAK